MARFRDGQVRCLVATDVVGRGIDVTGISHIINYDIPQFCDDYVHRVGRTGRMGREGVAYTFVTPEEGPELTRIEMRIDRLLTRDEMDGFDALARTESAAVGVGASPPGAATSVEGLAPAGAVAAVSPSPPLSLLRGGRPPRRIRRAL
jgi:ATP-dependent RNA helicase DeaD